MAKVDLDNYYHRIRTPAWMHSYFALPPVRAADVGRGDEYGPDAMVYPCCTTLPMCWSHSAFLEAVHEHLLDTRTQLRQPLCLYSPCALVPAPPQSRGTNRIILTFTENVRSSGGACHNG